MSLVYCVEDDIGIRELILCALKSGGYEVIGFENGKELMKNLSGNSAFRYGKSDSKNGGEKE